MGNLDAVLGGALVNAFTHFAAVDGDDHTMGRIAIKAERFQAACRIKQERELVMRMQIFQRLRIGAVGIFQDALKCAVAEALGIENLRQGLSRLDRHLLPVWRDRCGLRTVFGKRRQGQWHHGHRCIGATAAQRAGCGGDDDGDHQNHGQQAAGQNQMLALPADRPSVCVAMPRLVCHGFLQRVRITCRGTPCCAAPGRVLPRRRVLIHPLAHIHYRILVARPVP